MRIPAKKLVVGAGLVSAAIAASIYFGALQPLQAAPPLTVVILRCLAMESPTFHYQVTTFSKTPNLALNIDASTASGQGANCAVAIQQMLSQSGASTAKMTMQATENAVVVTFIY